MDLLITLFTASNWGLQCVCHEECDFTWPPVNYSRNTTSSPPSFSLCARPVKRCEKQLENVGLVTVLYMCCAQTDALPHMDASGRVFQGVCSSLPSSILWDALMHLFEGGGCPTARQQTLQTTEPQKSCINVIASLAFWLINCLIIEISYRLIAPPGPRGVKTYRVHE